MGEEFGNKHFAIIIDEAHSGQNGLNSAQMNIALSGNAFSEDMDNEDKINVLMEGRKLISNASYFAFTATPKNKTLETFGVPYADGDEIKHRPFHVYTMKQAIQEGFILDVLQNYTTIDSFYKLMKKVEDDPMFDKKRAQKKLRSFVESDEYTISKKASMMVEHFHEQVIAKGKVGGQARAMVVTASIPRCVEYYYAINRCLTKRNSPYKAIVAFSGEHKYHGQDPALTSAGLNGFSDAKTPKTFKKDPYRILVVADMFQTGFDEPLLHTMYVDKILTDIKAVQTLSRLNRCHPKKHDTFVLDFANKPEDIQASFSRYYRTTILSGETDPNKLYDLVDKMEKLQVYSHDQVETLVNLYLDGAARDKLDSILDYCEERYIANWMKTIRLFSKVLQRYLSEHMASLEQFCLMGMSTGRSFRYSSTCLFQNFHLLDRRIIQKGFWRQSTLRVTGMKHGKRLISNLMTLTQRLTQFLQEDPDISHSPSLII